MNQGKTASCIREVQRSTAGKNGDFFRDGINLTGKGILFGIVDSGIDVTHPDFRNADGTTRILSYWDQSGEGIPPEGYLSGAEYTSEEMNAFLRQENSTNVERIPKYRGTIHIYMARK